MLFTSVRPAKGMLESHTSGSEEGLAPQGASLLDRNMKSFNGNIGLINKNTTKVFLDWLDKWHIPYDEIIYGKPWPGNTGFYVDDRTVRPDEFLQMSVGIMQIIC